MLDRPTRILLAAAVAICLAPSSAVMASEVFACQELKAAVADAARGFAAHKGTLLVSASPAILPSKIYQAKKTMTGAKTCRVLDVSLDEPQMQIRQAGYSCQYPTVFKLDKALRAQLTRCVSGEVDDDSDPDDFTIWVDRVSSGEGYRGTEVSAQVNAVDGLTLWVRQTVCTNTGNDRVCEE